MRTAIPRRRRAVEGAWVMVWLLLAASACGPADSSGTADTRWAVVQEYLGLQAAWEQRVGNLRNIVFSGEGTVDEMVQRAEQEHGPLPDTTAALTAAQQIVTAGGPHSIEAAQFLIERTSSPPCNARRQRGGKHGKLAADCRTRGGFRKSPGNRGRNVGSADR